MTRLMRASLLALLACGAFAQSDEADEAAAIAEELAFGAEGALISSAHASLPASSLARAHSLT